MSPGKNKDTRLFTDSGPGPSLSFAGSPDLARFVIDNHFYVVLTEDLYESMSFAEPTASGVPHGEKVGEFTKNGKTYVIVSLNGEMPEVLSSGLVNVLTKREIQIVMLVAEGRVNKEIADRLQISEWTVATHLRRIFAKLGVDSRAAMIFRCARLILT